MALASAVDTGYWRICQIAKADPRDGVRQAEEFKRDISDGAVREVAARLAYEAYRGNEERLGRDLSKVALLSPDVVLNEEESLHVLMLVWRAAEASFGGRPAGLEQQVRLLRIREGGGGIWPYWIWR